MQPPAGLGVDQLHRRPTCHRRQHHRRYRPSGQSCRRWRRRQICPVTPSYEMPATSSRTAARVTVLPADQVLDRCDLDHRRIIRRGAIRQQVLAWERRMVGRDELLRAAEVRPEMSGAAMVAYVLTAAAPAVVSQAGSSAMPSPPTIGMLPFFSTRSFFSAPPPPEVTPP